MFKSLFIMILWCAASLQAAEQTITYSNGDVYTGEIKNGWPHGRGRMKYSNGREYSGEWFENVRQGYGEQTWTKSPKYISYQGHWAKDLPQGTGTLSFHSGQVYTGDFHQAKFHGEGQMTHSNGDKRYGKFVGNKREGEFLLITAKGLTYKEMFVQDKRVSITRIENPTQQKYYLRGSLERLVDSYGITTGLKIRAFGDNNDLPRHGVEVGDILLEICDMRLSTHYDFQRADGILMAKEKPCTIKLQRKGLKLTLNDIN